jgi:hypothetical protein
MGVNGEWSGMALAACGTVFGTPFTYSLLYLLFNYKNLFSIDKVTTLDNLVIQLILVFCTIALLNFC